MTAELIDGKQIALDRQKILQGVIARYVEQGNRPPSLHVIQVGDNPASTAYIGRKTNAAECIGLEAVHHHLPITTDRFQVLRLIRQLNEDPTVDGIIVQLPLPDQILASVVCEAIDPKKDVDGFHPYNLGRLACRIPALRPCTPHGVIHLLNSVGEKFKERHAVVVGASNIVGRPMMLELLLAGATVSIAHRFTPAWQLHDLTLQADILISAVGKPDFIDASHVKKGATVIDVGITKNFVGQLAGDVAKSVREVAAYVTPVPGGVGPMTVCTLLENCVQAYELTLQKG